MATLALQMAATGNDWSLTRDTQLRTQLETALSHIHGSGVVSGGYVSRTAAFAVEVANGTVFFTEGVTLTLSAAAAYSSLVAGTNYLWGVITVTRANPTLPAASDTYALTLTHNTTGTAPSSRHFLLAEINCRTAGMDAQSDIENQPTTATKYIRIPRVVTVASASAPCGGGKTWLVECDFSAVGEFGDTGYRAILDPSSTATGIVINEELQRKTQGRAAWRVFVPTGAGAVSAFTATLAGDGWSGSSSTGITGVWAAPVEVETTAAEVMSAFDDLERRFQALVFSLGTFTDLPILPPLERDFELGSAVG